MIPHYPERLSNMWAESIADRVSNGLALGEVLIHLAPYTRFRDKQLAYTGASPHMALQSYYI